MKLNIKIDKDKAIEATKKSIEIAQAEFDKNPTQENQDKLESLNSYKTSKE